MPETVSLNVFTQNHNCCTWCITLSDVDYQFTRTAVRKQDSLTDMTDNQNSHITVSITYILPLEKMLANLIKDCACYKILSAGLLLLPNVKLCFKLRNILYEQLKRVMETKLLFSREKSYLKTWQYFTVSYSHIKLHYFYINNAKYTVSNKSYVNMK